ncbi:MAG: hypothetical protein IT291_04900 [Deltaproteobacteria bacterium]|nr:hypothetical protein [Deltaproteobacteria bacterium]
MRKFAYTLQLIVLLALIILLPTRYAIANPDTVSTGRHNPSSLIIRTITIQIADVFDEPDIGSFYQTVNNLKISTREDIIRRELLFKEGDKLDTFLLQESERVLRSLPFLHKVSITPIRDGKYIDIIVSVQDTWTLIPQFSFSTGSGSDKMSAGIVETNVMGYGKRAELFYADDEGRKKIEGVWDDQRLLGSYKRLLLGHFQRSDGYRFVGFFGQPFRNLIEKTSWGVNTDLYDIVGKLFVNGDERFIYRTRNRDVHGNFSHAFGDPEDVLHRGALGYRYLRTEFISADEDDFDDVDVDPESVSTDPSLLAQDREFSGPTLSYERIEPDFVALNYIDRFERVEDFNLGNQFILGLHLASHMMGSAADTAIISANESDGFRLSPLSFVRGDLGISSRLDNSGAENSIIRGELKYYAVLGSQYAKGFFIGKHTLASSFAVDYSEDLDRDKEFLLGASEGLRGYESRTFTGDKRVILNVEDRFHITEDVFRLVSIGGVFFFDVGGSTTDSFGNLISSDLYSDVGFGLRFGFPRSSGGSVLRIDFAIPLRNSPEDDDKFEPRILITTGQVFDANFQSENQRAANPQTSSIIGR